MHVAGHRGVAAAGIGRGQFRVDVILPPARERMGSDRQHAAGDRGPDAVEDRVDEIGEMPRDGIAAVLSPEHRLADSRGANV